jgi:hypothetical protein
MSEQDKQNESTEEFLKVFGGFFEELFKPESNEKVNKLFSELQNSVSLDPLDATFKALNDAAVKIKEQQETIIQLQSGNNRLFQQWNKIIHDYNNQVDVINTLKYEIDEKNRQLDEGLKVVGRLQFENVTLNTSLQEGVLAYHGLNKQNDNLISRLQSHTEGLLEQSSLINDLQIEIENLKEELDFDEPERKVFFDDMGDYFDKQENFKLLRNIFFNLKKEVVETASSTLDEMVEITQDKGKVLLENIRKSSNLRRTDEHIEILYDKIAELENRINSTSSLGTRLEIAELGWDKVFMFTIDVGNMPAQKVKEHIEGIKEQVKQVIGNQKAIYFAKHADGSGTSVKVA